jgi:hypothetical protein
MSNVHDFLKEISEKVDTIVPVFVPTRDETMAYQQITVQQQKKIIKNTLEGVQGNLRLPQIFNSIICDNHLEGNTLTIADRNAIIVQLRIAAVGTAVVDDSGNATELDPDKIKSQTEVPLIMGNRFEYKGIKAYVSVPTIAKDNQYFRLLENRAFGTAGDIVNELYIHETAKFIEKVEFEDLSIEPNPKESVELVNKLPLALNNKVLEFIKGVKDYDNRFLIAKNGAQLGLNARFFNTPD